VVVAHGAAHTFYDTTVLRDVSYDVGRIRHRPPNLLLQFATNKT
jgi:hypothetical protein